MQNEPIRLEDYPQTHEGGVAFVRDVFKSMGGTVVPPPDYHEDGLWYVEQGFQRMGGTVVHAPTRPGKARPLYMSIQRDAFFMDFENACLATFWNSSEPHPKGEKRHLNKKWAEMIRSQVCPNRSDIDWYENVEWATQGGGDEWFQGKSEDL